MTAAATRLVALVLVAGLATGVVTQLGQSLLPTDWSQAANAISPWLFVAFLVGSAMPGWRAAGLAGAATLVLAMIGYYAMTMLRFGIGGSTASLVFWGLGAVVGGPVFGAAGWWWRHGSHRSRASALGLLTAAFIAEAGYHAIVLAEPPVALGFVIAGLLVPLILGRSRDDRLGAYVAAVPATLLGALGFAGAIWIYSLIASVA
ncbi:MAG TPA: DUF6518 family protein [Candidatus Limnocylindrales bacterium]|nr:DUF6518 family protein [Candidatus Limnocylindrales bacterium]